MVTSAPGFSKWGMISPFFVILLLHSLAIYLFTRGFLLTRTELSSSFSRCSDLPPTSPCNLLLNSSSSSSSSSSGASEDNGDSGRRCWTRPAVDRLVIIVLDALRFDFVAPSTFFEEKKPWMDKLTVLQKLALEERSSARIFKAIADPPTTSLQRLKGLTTGGLPTFIDIGNSFGAPAIVEDNLIHQLATNGKRVMMMGDDTWVQLFPDHFNTSYPYPSFNVKDLDTVDNGVIEHLLPSLHKDNWDVLIAHFLGVDHAGHIYGVESTPMIQKLEQYNAILEDVVNVLKSHSGPGGLHENTFLLVMGDHGQTLNGDHGGGTAEEVETSLFAMSLRSPPASISNIFDESFCKLHMDGKRMCIGTFEQIDFAVTISAILGIPFPFGSIGRVNPELYALTAGAWQGQRVGTKHCEYLTDLEAWEEDYARTLCINAWQVKRYIDVYSATSIIGLPSQDLQHVAHMYNQAQAKWSDTIKTACSPRGVPERVEDNLKSSWQRQFDAYSKFLKDVSKLARSAWTEFDLVLMGIGLSCMLGSLFYHVSAIRRINIVYRRYSNVTCIFDSSNLVAVVLLVAVRAASFMSNSYILTEGTVASFLLATTATIRLLSSVSKWKFSIDEFIFLLLVIIIRHGIGVGMTKQNTDINFFSTYITNEEYPLLMIALEVLPVILLFTLAVMIYKYTYQMNYSIKCILMLSTIASYMLIALHWVYQSNLMPILMLYQYERNLFPRTVYAIGMGLLLLSVLYQLWSHKGSTSSTSERITVASVIWLSAWSSTILILLGKQGPFVALLCIVGARCIIRSPTKARADSTCSSTVIHMINPTPVLQWSLLAVCLFFYTGHWCTFDGLRYGAAFIGFDHFNIIRQGILLSIDTFGVSHILPVLSLPLIVTLEQQSCRKVNTNDAIFLKLTQVFLIYGLITATTATFTIICVTIQRRHLMVWGLFAPKYVFDSVGLLLTDVLICVASLYYF